MYPPAGLLAWLFVMGPHPQYFYGVFGFADLVDEAVLNVNAPGVSAGEITHEPFVRGRILERVSA